MKLKSVPGGWVNTDLLKTFETVDTALVDGAPWYVIRTYNQQIAAWLRGHPQEQRAEYGGSEYRHGSIFDVREDLYVALSLKWR